VTGGEDPETVGVSKLGRIRMELGHRMILAIHQRRHVVNVHHFANSLLEEVKSGVIRTPESRPSNHRSSRTIDSTA
jgi:hypothetical protein